MTIEAKDAQIGVTYRNKSGMEATALGGGMFHTAFGDLDIEPDEPLTEIGVAVAPAATSEAPPPVVVERFIEAPVAAELPEDVAVEPPAAAVVEVPAVAEVAPATTVAEGFLRPRCACSECGEDVSLVKGEVARKHWRGARTEANLCPGSGKPPKGAVVELAAAEVVPPVPKTDAPWAPAVGDRVVTTETGDEVAVVDAIDPGDPDGAYQLRWETGEVTCGWPMVQLRPAAVVPEAVAVAPSPVDASQVQERVEVPDPEAGEEAAPSEEEDPLFSDPDPDEGEFPCLIIGHSWQEPPLAYVEGIPESEREPAAVPEDDEGWLDCATDPPDDEEEVIAEARNGDRFMTRTRTEDGVVFAESFERRGARVVRWKPWKKAQPDQTAEIARLTARVEVLTAEAEAANAACAGAEGAARDMLGALAKIGVALAEGRSLTEEDAARMLSVRENRAALVARVRRLVEENEAHRAVARSSRSAPQEDAAARLALEELVGSLQAQLEVAEAKVARYHKAARRAAGAVLAALGDEP